MVLVFKHIHCFNLIQNTVARSYSQIHATNCASEHYIRYLKPDTLKTAVIKPGSMSSDPSITNHQGFDPSSASLKVEQSAACRPGLPSVTLQVVVMVHRSRGSATMDLC